jgi:hypothetical protein
MTNSAANESLAEQVQLLDVWEQEEITQVYRLLTAIVSIYQSSAALAIVRLTLEIGASKGQ